MIVLDRKYSKKETAVVIGDPAVSLRVVLF